MKAKIFVAFLVILSSSLVFAGNHGLIKRLDVSGSDSKWGSPHKNIIQIQIEGDYDNPSCNYRMAGIRSTETHLISAVMLALASGKEITVHFSNTDRYLGSRCIISDVYVHP